MLMGVIMASISVLYRIPAPYVDGEFVEVYGEPEMGWYEWRIVVGSRVLRDSRDRGYGAAEVALRDGLIAVTEDL